MEQHDGQNSFELICVVVDFGKGSEVLQHAKRLGISGGTVFWGENAVGGFLFDLLSLRDIRKEIILMGAEKVKAGHVLELLVKEFEFDEPGNGAGFTISVCGVTGARCFVCEGIKERKDVDGAMYHLITAIVDKGKAEMVIDAAVKVGSSGGVIINARGSGVNETQKVFLMDIEPEKEIVLILSNVEKTGVIVASVRKDLKMDEPGNGIIFIQDVNKAYGSFD